MRVLGAMPTALRGHVFGQRFHVQDMPTQGGGHGTQRFARVECQLPSASSHASY
jgi:hypothetical protein